MRPITERYSWREQVYDMRVVVDLLHIGRNMLGSMIPLYSEFPVVNNDVYPVILSGGSGTRLWPLSRQHYPKQFLPLNSEFTLFQEAAMRLRGVNAPIMVCNEIHRFVLAEQLQQIGVTPSAIFLEPVARNTAPAIALAAFEALTLNENAVLVVLAADHKIERSDVFEVPVNQAINEAQSGTLVTFGVV